MKIAHVKSLYDRIGGIESLLGNLMPEMLDQPGVEPVVVLIADRRHPEMESRLSAGAKSPVCPMMAQPTLRTTLSKRALSGCETYPGIASILSSVPPVCPNPRPEIIGT